MDSRFVDNSKFICQVLTRFHWIHAIDGGWKSLQKKPRKKQKSEERPEMLRVDEEEASPLIAVTGETWFYIGSDNLQKMFALPWHAGSTLVRAFMLLFLKSCWLKPLCWKASTTGKRLRDGQHLKTLVVMMSLVEEKPLLDRQRQKEPPQPLNDWNRNGRWVHNGPEVVVVAHAMMATARLVIPSLLMLDFVLGGQIIVSDQVDCWSRGLRSHEEPVGISWNQQGLAVTERASLEKDEVTKAKGGEKDNRWCAWNYPSSHQPRALHPGMRAIPVALLRPISRETDEKDALCHSAWYWHIVTSTKASMFFTVSIGFPCWIPGWHQLVPGSRAEQIVSMGQQLQAQRKMPRFLEMRVRCIIRR